MKLEVNTKATQNLTIKLQQMHRSAFPSAVRNTLNDAAFEAKKLVPNKASQEFTIRQKGFINRFTKIEKAKGFDVNAMNSKIGISKDVDKVSKGLATQETGGNIKSRKLIPHDMGRVSGSYAKKLKSKNQFSKMGNIGTRQKRVKGAKYILIKNNGGKGTVFEVKNKKLTPIYSYRPTRISHVKARPFINPSAVDASKKMDFFYKKNAEFQFKKYMK